MYCSQSVALQVSTSGNSCYAGQEVRLSATATTANTVVDTAGYDFTWAYDASESAYITVDGSILTYKCDSLVGEHPLTVKAVSKSAFIVQPSKKKINIKVVTAPLAYSVVTLENTAHTGVEVQQLVVGEVATLTIQFTDGNKTSLHSYLVDWGDSKWVVGPTDYMTGNSLVVQHEYKKVPEGGASFLINIIVFDDNPYKPQIIETTKAITVTRAVSHSIRHTVVLLFQGVCSALSSGSLLSIAFHCCCCCCCDNMASAYQLKCSL
jgi:hypothetical protein